MPVNVRPGLAIFVRKSLKVLGDGGFRGYDGGAPIGAEYGGRATGSCQWVEAQITETSKATIVNVHGLWQKGTNKSDTPERLIQSKILQNFLHSKGDKKILCGDFNLKPDSKSIEIFEQDMTNLVKKSGAVSTRSSHYTKLEKFADYVFVSQDIEVKHFEVLSDDVSDHLPFLLEFK